jgi:serine/threonine protein kinase
LGFSKLIGANGTFTSRAVSGNTTATSGTHLYIPECLLNVQKASVASDMWSVGATLSKLYTGFTYWNFSEAEFDDVSNVNDCLRAKMERRERPDILEKESF